MRDEWMSDRVIFFSTACFLPSGGEVDTMVMYHVMSAGWTCLIKLRRRKGYVEFIQWDLIEGIRDGLWSKVCDRGNEGC